MEIKEEIFPDESMERTFHFPESVCPTITYSCDQCDYTANKYPTLKMHMKSKHDGIRYPCDQCDYSATENGNLKKHKKFKHQGVKYPCDQCDYSATVLSSLKRHQALYLKKMVAQYPVHAYKYGMIK